MDRCLQDQLDALHAHGREHDARRSDRLARLRNLEPDSARLLSVIVQALAPRRMLELGTSNGYSTVWLADAARRCGTETFVSVELDAERSAQARTNLSRAGLDDAVELRVADAGDVLADSADASWDLIFLDAERPQYAGYWPDLVRTLAPRGLLAVDNVVSHAAELVGFRGIVAGDPRVQEAQAPTGAGLLLVVRAGAERAAAERYRPGP